MPAARRHSAGTWAVVIALTAATFSFGVPLLPQLLPQERPVVQGEVFPVSIGTVDGPVDWTLDIRAAATGTPVFSRDSVTVVVFDGIWFGNSAALVDNLATTLQDRGAEVSMPDVSDEAMGESREQYTVDYAQGDRSGQMIVVREDVAVMILRATGTAEDLAESTQAIEEMAASLSTGVLTESAPPTDPGVRQWSDDAWIQRAVGSPAAPGSQS